jgi:AbrB family looped-hinge helix DNA binding protein
VGHSQTGKVLIQRGLRVIPQISAAGLHTHESRHRPPGINLDKEAKPSIFTVRRYGEEMKNSSTISSKGQVTVPQEIRLRLGLSAGDRVEFVVEGERIVIRPARGAASSFETYKCALRTFAGGGQADQRLDARNAGS